jgi:RND family efflux transporter MFP subunit
LFIGLSAVLVACSKPAPVAEPVRAVRVLTVGEGAMQATAEFAGEVRARVESRLGFRVGGKITRRLVENGDRVKAGQVLAEIDPQDYALAADAAQAQVQAALTNRDLAAADLKRFKDLLDKNFISAAEFERRDTTLKAAQAQLDQAQAQLSSQRNQAAYTRLIADASGVITAIEAEPGQVVGAGVPVVRLAQDGARDAVFAVPEDKLLAWRVGQDVRVQLWGAATSMKAKVREIAGSADPVSRTFAIKVALPDVQAPLGATVTIVPQGGARAGVAVGAQVIKLPTTALRQEGGQSAVWVVDTNTMTVASQAVVVDTADGNQAIIQSGLKAGQVVVSAGVHVLSPGQKVSYYQERVVAPVAPSPAAK